MPTAPEKDIGILRAARYLNRYLKDFRSDGSETHSEIEDQIRKLKTMISQEAEDDNESEPENRPAAVKGKACPRKSVSIDAEERQAKATALTTQRLDGILSHFQKDPVVVAELAGILTGSLTRDMQHAEAEDTALSILCRGYSLESSNDYVQAVRGLSLAVLHGSKHCQNARDRSIVTDALVDQNRRIQSRHEHLGSLAGHLQAGSWVLRTVHQIEALKFAIDWRASTADTKRRFHEDAFCAREEVKELVENLEPDERMALLRKEGELVDEFRRWKRANERVVTGRNRLWMLYNLFGAAVLIDPTWSVDTLGVRCSRTFGHVLEQLACSIPKDFDPATDTHSAHMYLERLYRRGEYALNCITKGVYPEPVFGTYLAEFLDSNPPGIDIE